MPNYSSNNGTFHRTTSSYVDGGRFNFHEIGKNGEIKVKGSIIKDEVLGPIKKESPVYKIKKNRICKHARDVQAIKKDIADVKRDISNDQRDDVGI